MDNNFGINKFKKEIQEDLVEQFKFIKETDDRIARCKKFCEKYGGTGSTYESIIESKTERIEILENQVRTLIKMVQKLQNERENNRKEK